MITPSVLLALAPAFTVADSAPDTFPDLISTARLTVWSGASDSTIYGDPVLNWCARAWHDATHLSLGADFSLEGETRTAEAQIVALYRRFPSAPDVYASIIRAEVIEQASYCYRTGSFPADQVSFVRSVLNRTS